MLTHESIRKGNERGAEPHLRPSNCSAPLDRPLLLLSLFGRVGVQVLVHRGELQEGGALQEPRTSAESRPERPELRGAEEQQPALPGSLHREPFQVGRRARAVTALMVSDLVAT